MQNNIPDNVRSWKELAEEALAVQDACNLPGVVNSFSGALKDVRARLEMEGTLGNQAVHLHPVCKLFSDKIASLTGTQNASVSEMTFAYNWAYKVSG